MLCGKLRSEIENNGEPTLDKVSREDIFEVISNPSLENKKEQTMTKWRARRWRASQTKI